MVNSEKSTGTLLQTNHVRLGTTIRGGTGEIPLCN
jgi:hypothetical protein